MRVGIIYGSDSHVIIAAKGTLKAVAGRGPVGVEHLPVGNDLLGSRHEQVRVWVFIV